jgi:TolB-like protein/tRNA A-37 threonylcarbamoyl transferase component Bud32
LRLRVTLPAAPPPRLRVHCGGCATEFAVRRAEAPEEAAITRSPVAGSTVLAAAATLQPLAEHTTPLSAASRALRPAAALEAVFAPGDLLAGRYRVRAFLAQGGMGEVYEVDDLVLHDRAALKTVRPEVARDAFAIERFKREIHLARKVTHPNVCRIFDLGQHRPEGAPEGSEVLFLTMELLVGETLAERLKREGPMTPEQARPIVRQVLAGLAAAHQAGIVHRDLKPGNVFLTACKDGDNRAVVTDFGLARAEGLEAGHLTPTAAGVIGTPAYLAPEQVQGGEITPAVDVYSLGIVLYEMLTGKVPFVGDTALSIAVKRLQEMPASPRLHAPGLDARWEAVILRCLERDPARRFQTPGEVARALAGEVEVEAPAAGRGATMGAGAAVAGGASVVVGSPTAAAPRAASAQPPPRRRAAVAALTLLILASFGVAAWRVQGWLAEQREKERVLALPGTAAVVPRRAVAVLGFQNSVRRTEAAWLSGALTEMLSTELGAASELRVVASENVARTKRELGLADTVSLAPDTLARLRAALGADYVVLGSYLALPGAGGKGQLRLDLRLQDTARGETRSVAESGGEAELFALVARSGERLRRALGAGSAGAGAARAALPSNPLAARLYAEGLAQLRDFQPLAARDLLRRPRRARPGQRLPAPRRAGPPSRHRPATGGAALGRGWAPRRDDGDADGGGERQRGADREGDRGAEAVPEDAEEEGGGEGAEAEGQVVPAEGGAAAVGRHEVGDQRLLDPLGQAEVDAVDREQRPGLPLRPRQPEPQVDEGVEPPTRDQERLAPNAVGERPAGRAGERLDHVEEGPEDRHQRRRHAELRGTQQEEGVGRVAEGEEEDDTQHRPEAAGEGGVAARRRHGGGGGDGDVAPRLAGRPAGLAHREDQHGDRQHAGDGRPQKDLAQRQVGPTQEGEGKERPHHRARVVAGALEAEGAAAHGGVDRVGDQGVARRGAHPLSDAVREPDRQHLPDGARQAHQRPHRRREGVAGDDQRLAPRHAVGEPAARQLQEGRGRLGRPLDRPQRRGAGPQLPHQEHRQQGVDHLARDVGQEADDAERDDVLGEAGRGPHGSLV